MKTAKQSIDLEYKGTKKRLNLRTALISLCMFAFVGTSAQTGTVTVKLRNASVKELFGAIEKQTSYRFSYRDAEIKGKVNVTISATNRELKQLLEGELSKLGLKYAVSGNKIIVTPVAAAASAQPKKVTGKVVDANGEPVIGATIKEQGTANGTITDFDGNFTLDVADNAMIEVSYIGYKSQELKAVAGKTLSVTLKEDTEVLDEVVVVGYGTQKKGEVASAIVSVKSENFLKIPSPDAAQMIRGQVPGLTIVNPDANPLSTSQLSLRGTTTLLSSTDPLILIDGIPGSLDTVSPDEIEQIDVLKDGSAAAIYGTRGTNGVILITTKHVNGEVPTTVDVNTYISVQQIMKKLPMMTASQYREKIVEGVTGGATDYGGDVNWLDEITRTPISQVYNISLKGGSKTTNYVASLEYRKLQGIIERSDNNIIYPRIEVTHRMFNDKLRINAGLNGSLKKYFDGADGGGYKTDVYLGALQFNPTDPIKDENGNWKERPINDYRNPLAFLWESEGENKETILRMFANVTLNPLKGLNIKYTASRNTFNQTRGYYETKQHSSTTKDGRNGYASRGTRYTCDTMSELTAQYNQVLFDKHYITLLGGYSWLKNSYEDYWMQNWDFPSDDYSYNNMSAGQALRDGKAYEGSVKKENLLIGYFARLNYNYKEKYILSASVRREGSSKFGENHKWGTFPAISVAWNIGEEEFIKKINILSNLKLRAGFGITGTEPSEPYMSLRTITFDHYAYFNNAWLKSICPSSNTNPDLRWEKKEELNIGLDFGMFDNRLSGSIDFYRRETKDLIWNYNVPSPPYLFSTITANGGTIQNKGLEVSLQAIPIFRKDFQWKTAINYSSNSNKLVSLSNSQFVAGTYQDAGWTGTPIQQYTHRVQEGEPIGNFWGYKTIDVDENGYWIIEDEKGQPKPIADALPSDKKILGNGLPKHYLNWNNSFSYKNFDLSLSMRGAFGFQIWNAADAFHGVPAMFAAGWNVMEKAFDPVFGKRPLAIDQPLAYVSYHVEDGDYWKIDNLTLGYTWSINKFFIKTIRLFGSISNLAVITGYSGIDPETPIGGMDPGIDNRYRYPSARTYTMGVSFKF